MAKAIVIDGKHYRMRRGKLVEIPPEWVGKVTSQQTINKRASKHLHKHRKLVKYAWLPLKAAAKPRVQQKLLDEAVLGEPKSSVHQERP